MEVATPFVEVANAIVEAGGEDLTLCYQCSTCTGSCPWTFVEPLNMRQLIHLAQLGMEGYETDDLWKCTTCGTCVERCPRGVEIVDLVRSIRMMMGETGLIPQTLRGVLGSVRSNGNPWNGARAERNAWAEGLGIPRFEKTKTEYLLYSCCMPSWDPRARKIVTALAKVLKAAGVSAGVLGPEEHCCGESVRKIGNESLFDDLANGNVALFKEKGVTKILTVSPHCLYTLKKEYPEHGGKFEVVHTSELIADLIAKGRLNLAKEEKATVAYHDPCYLGRQSQIYEAPRRVLSALPGVKLQEMIRNRESSLCCGGGGGRMWMETKFGDRFSDLRVPEAIAVGADVLATGCPYCISMLEDSRANLNQTEAIQVLDISELVAERLA